MRWLLVGSLVLLGCSDSTAPVGELPDCKATQLVMTYRRPDGSLYKVDTLTYYGNTFLCKIPKR